ncbi:MAG: hypothetical protein WDO73_12030 [Ignavibacteriota bacterium]
MGSGILTLPPRPFLQVGIGKTLAVAALLPIVLLPPAIAIHMGAYDSFVDNPIAGFGMWGTFTIHIWTRPGRREQILTVGLALACVWRTASQSASATTPARSSSAWESSSGSPAYSSSLADRSKRLTIGAPCTAALSAFSLY